MSRVQFALFFTLFTLLPVGVVAVAHSDLLCEQRRQCSTERAAQTDQQPEEIENPTSQSAPSETIG